MWDGEFCGSIGFRWQPGTEVLPPHCLGHIGYAVVPWKKRRGHATRALAAMLPLARAEGLRYVELFVRLPSARADRSPCRRPKTLCGAIFVNGCPRGAYTFISSSVSLFDLGSPFLRSLIATQKASTKLSASHDFFLTSHFPSSTAPQAFPRPDRGDAHAVEQRSRQGWPLFRPPPGLALMRPSTMAHCFDRGSLSSLSLSPQHSTNC